MKVIYVNVNEDGEEYDRHDKMEDALAVQGKFPNDRVEVRKVEGPTYELIYHFDGISGPGDRRAFELVTDEDGSETLHVNMKNSLMDLMLGYDLSEEEDGELVSRVTAKQRSQIELVLWSLAQAHRDTPRGDLPEWQVSLNRVFEDMDIGGTILRGFYELEPVGRGRRDH